MHIVYRIDVKLPVVPFAGAGAKPLCMIVLPSDLIQFVLFVEHCSLARLYNPPIPTRPILACCVRCNMTSKAATSSTTISVASEGLVHGAACRVCCWCWVPGTLEPTPLSMHTINYWCPAPNRYQGCGLQPAFPVPRFPFLRWPMAGCCNWMAICHSTVYPWFDDKCLNPRDIFRPFHAPHPSKNTKIEYI